MNFSLKRYTAADIDVWNAAVDNIVRQKSFLLNRNYMEYHSDRFTDASLMVLEPQGKVLALFPANVCRKDSRCVESHGGLTYGGLLMSPHLTAKLTGEVFEAIIAYYRERGFNALIYKPMPYIYCEYPCQEDLYWLFRNKATLLSRQISSVIDLAQPYSLSTLRKRKVKKAEKLACLRMEMGAQHLKAYWQILDGVLQLRHDTLPVHTFEEMQLLMQRFPRNIQLAVCIDHVHNEVLAGCLLYITPQVVHAQYIASNDRGCEVGALDLLFRNVIAATPILYKGVRYFDFGTCNEHGGWYLNEGLIFQKEGFGGRAVCYDSYLINY